MTCPRLTTSNGSVRTWTASGSDSGARRYRRYRSHSLLRSDRAQGDSAVRKLVQAAPAWLEVRSQSSSSFDALFLKNLDEGEKAALALAASVPADLLLMDDRAGVRVARRSGFRVIGTLRVLELAARRGLIDLSDAFHRQELIDELLAQR